jgi:enoyl-CoA hydratase/carnithine racemase
MIEKSQNGAVLRLVINRPEKKNALTLDMYRAMADALATAQKNAETAVILFEGQPGVFCAGNDISTFLGAAQSGDLGPVLDFLRALIGIEKPLVAAVDGPAVGVGATMLFHCDYVIGTETATFSTPFTDLGLVPEAASSLLGPGLMGHHRAFRMLALGERFSVTEAKEAGLISELAPSQGLAAHAMAVATRIASKPRRALLAARRLLKPDKAVVMARMEMEAALFVEHLRSSEARAAFEAFLARGNHEP